jgi:hypothetical protein
MGLTALSSIFYSCEKITCCFAGRETKIDGQF